MVKNLATWGQRFWAWLIDILIVGFAAGFTYPFWGIAGGSLIFFLYWTILEFYRGQSIGKIAFSIKVVNKNGGKITLVQSALQSFGKAFLLSIDVIVGLIVFRKENQRLFNKVSNTFVVNAK